MPARSSSNLSADGADPDGAPALLEDLVHQAEAAEASDIHLQFNSPCATLHFRLDGVLTHIADLPSNVAERVIGRIKYLARLKTYQESLPQDGRIDKEVIGATTDLRVSTYPTVTGEKVVLRLFRATGIRPISEIDFTPEVTRELQLFLRRNTGMLLLTGPAGSGKTTTIYACLKELSASGGRHIITVEDPAEQIIPGIMQTEVNEARGLTFAEASRHLLRQDPQVLMIGEIRDDETANIAVRAALTGHLVISTLHAGSCQGVFQRLLVLCPEASAVASSLELVINQRLVRRFCGSCRGKGCDACLNTGFHGRLPVAEFVRVTDEVRSSISHRNLFDLAAKPSLAQVTEQLIASGLTSPAEGQRVLCS